MTLAFAFPGVAAAHPGGLNAEGCHNNRKTGEYHCHRSPGEPAAQPARRAPPPAPRPSVVARLPFYDPPAPIATAGDVLVGPAQVTDGDTIVISGQRVRLHGVDAFEAEQSCTGATGRQWGCGGVATRAVQEIVADHEVICLRRDTDRYGRMVAVCRAGGVDLSAAIVARGLGVAYRKYAFDYVPEEELAKRLKAGAWAGSFVAPEDHRRAGNAPSAAVAARASGAAGQCLVKGNVNRAGRKLYHMPGDPNYDRTKAEAMFCSVDEAEAAGFARAR